VRIIFRIFAGDENPAPVGQFGLLGVGVRSPGPARKAGPEAAIQAAGPDRGDFLPTFKYCDLKEPAE
jgi:hypothetical protein